MIPTIDSTSGGYTLAVNQHLQRVQVVLLLFTLALTGAVSWWLSDNPYLSGLLLSPRFWFWYGLLTVSPLLLIFLLKQKKVVFSTMDRVVYSLSPFGRKRLMSFEEIGAIKPYTDSFGGTYFALFGRDNLYQRNPPRISPRFLTSAASLTAYQDFQQNELPRLLALLGNTRRSDFSTQPVAGDASLVYYRREGEVYFLRDTYNRGSQKKTAVYVMLAVSVIVLSSPGLRLQYINLGLGAGLGALITGFLLTEQKYLKDGQFYSEYWSGLFRQSYSLRQFNRFQITHRRMNFIYVGTEINMLFQRGDRNKPVFLCQLRKTAQVEGLIRETEHILNRELDGGTGIN